MRRERRAPAATVTLLWLTLLVIAGRTSADAECDRIGQCELVWSDEFEGTRVDESKWEIQTGTGTDYGLPAGWGNNELEYYQENNATVADGLLTITARRESVSGYDFTSARLRTLGSGDWTFGRMEMRARMPVGRGLWPAFWMLPSDPSIYGSWAASGEIDIMEYVGSDPERIVGTIHYGSPWPNNVFSSSEYQLADGSFDQSFHVFAVEWEPGEIRWYVDGIHYGTKTEWFSSGGPYPAPFDVEFHIVLNLAVGGNLPGAPDSTTSFPQQLVVDYVRVYQSAAKKGTQASTASVLFDKAVKMKKIDAALWTGFRNRARKEDGVQDPRRLSCSVRAQGRTSAVTAKGKLGLTLIGGRSGRVWTSATIQTSLDNRGNADFAADEVRQLIDAARQDAATIERIRVAYDGAGGKKVTRLDLDCWQQPD